MPKSFSAELGSWKASVERRLDNLSSGNRLDHASLDGTTLYLKGDGELGRIGRQPDGSNGVHVVKVQPPPQLTAPILTVGEQAGTCLVEWDGGTFDGRRMPLIHGHTEIWAELVGEDWSPTVAPGDTAKRVGTIRDRTGGEVVVALPQAGVWAVWLRAMGADRETAGPWSPVSQVEIVGKVDEDAIRGIVADGIKHIEEATEQLTFGQDVLDGKLEFLDTERLPALDSALTDTRLGMENLRDVRLPDLQATLNSGLADANEWRDVGAITASSLRVGNWENMIPDAKFLTDWWTGVSGFTRHTAAGKGADTLRFYAGGDTALDTAHYEAVLGARYTVQFDTYRNGAGSSADDYWVRAQFYDAGGNRVSQSDTYGGWAEGGVWNRRSYSFTVPDDERIVSWCLRWGFRNLVNGSVWIANPSMREMVGGDMVVENSLSARHIMAESIAAAVGEFLQITAENVAAEAIKAGALDVEDIFGATAVIEAIWTDIVRSRLIQSQGIITEDMIATGAITTPKLTVTEEMVGEVARLLRIEAGSLASNDIEAMRIVSSLIEASVYLIHDANDDVSVRLDGMDNFLRGSIHAGVSENSEIHLDYGTITLSTGWEDAENPGEITEQIDAPYLQFNQSRGNQVITPRIWVHDDGQLRISPGRTTAQNPHRGRLQIHGDVQSNRFIGNRADVRDVNLNTGSTSQPGGVHASGSEPGRVRFRGRLVNQRNSADTFTVGNTSSSYEVSPGGSWRAGVAYYTPAPTGTVYPFINFHINQWTSDNFNIVSGATSSRTAAGFTWNVGHIRGGNTATFWVQHFAVWN